MIRADKVWAGEGLKRPYTGAGVGVAVIDSGVDATHPDLPYGTKVKKSFYISADLLSGDEPFISQRPESVRPSGVALHTAEIADRA